MKWTHDGQIVDRRARNCCTRRQTHVSLFETEEISRTLLTNVMDDSLQSRASVIVILVVKKQSFPPRQAQQKFPEINAMLADIGNQYGCRNRKC